MPQTQNKLMSESFEMDGIWWLPEKPEEQIAGTLFYSPAEGCILKLKGAFGNKIDTPDNKFKKYKYVFGEGFDGNAVTLEKCMDKRFTSSGALVTQELLATQAYLGFRPINQQEVVFDSVTVKYSVLNKWFLNVKYNSEYSNRARSLTITEPEPIKAKLLDGTEITIHCYASEKLTVGTHVIAEDHLIEFKFKEPIKLEKALDYIIHLKNLLILFTGNPIFPLKISGFSKEHKTKFEDKEFENPIDVYFLQSIAPSDNSEVQRSEILIRYHEIERDLPAIILSFFADKEKYSKVLGSLMELYYDDSMFNQEKLLSLASALEMFHRNWFENHAFPEDEFRETCIKIIATFPAIVPHSHRNLLLEKLRYANEPTLKTRIAQMTEKINRFLGKLEIKDVKGFSKKVGNARNYLTHGNEKLKKYVENGTELFYLCEKMRMVVLALILAHLAVPHHVITSALGKKFFYLPKES